MLDVSLRAGVPALPARLARLPSERGPGLLRNHHDLLSARAVTEELFVLNRGGSSSKAQRRTSCSTRWRNTP
jgi:hypothetical protein